MDIPTVDMRPTDISASMDLLALCNRRAAVEPLITALRLRYGGLRATYEPRGRGIRDVPMAGRHLVVLGAHESAAATRDTIGRIRMISDVPIVVYGEKPTEAEVCSAIDAGADEYLYPKMSVIEKLARVAMVLERVKRLAAWHSLGQSTEASRSTQASSNEAA